MAIRLARRVSPLLVLLALGSSVLLASGPASAIPAAPAPVQAKPSIQDVQKRLGALAMRNTQLVEKFDHARVVVQQRQHGAAVAQRAADRAQAVYRRANVAFTSMIQAQYETGPLGAAGALLDSESGGNYLARMSTLDLLSTHDADVVALVSKARRTAMEKQNQAEELLAAAERERNSLAHKRAAVEKQINKYKRLLGMLTAQQRATYDSQLSPSVAAPANVPGGVTGAARTAVRFALAQVGKPYVFGAAGPDAYDCSGLTMAAWAAAGVNLPHSAADQYNYGTHVSEAQLQPGDLVFFYQPIEHVTIYIGDGMMVSAPTEGEDVQVVPLSYFQSDYAGATRLG
ncbi:MAG TPA: C40 family peptidase [Jatrophihabitans sp.]|nr:C40 family peptidase [Jatrophihabitans sp.]